MIYKSKTVLLRVNILCVCFQYLDRLYRKDLNLGKDYHHLQVSLYAEYDRPKLLPFLRLSTEYGLQGALEECQQRSLIPEMVFLLGQYQYTTWRPIDR